MKIVRAILFIFGLLFLMGGMTLVWGNFGVWDVWLDQYVLGTFLLVYGIVTLWIASVQSYKMLAGAGLAGLVSFGGAGWHLLSTQSPLFFWGEFALLTAVFCFWFFFFGLKVSEKKREKLPISTQCLFALTFTVTLIEGIYLLIPLPLQFPWLLEQSQAIVLGWFFIGAPLFFGWALFNASWENGYPGLFAIVIFDGLMIGPLLTLFSESVDVAVRPFFLWISVILVIGTGTWAVIELARRFFLFRKNSAG